MDLGEIRKEIDGVDAELLELFTRRMRLCEQVADYKIQNGMAVFQAGREKQVLDRIAEKAPKELEGASRLLFSQIMDISKCLQQDRLTEFKRIETGRFVKASAVACPGIRGSYSEEACIKAFGNEARIDYCDTFEQVFEAVNDGRVRYGIVPIENSTAGSVDDTYSLLEHYDMYICGRLFIPVNHVLAAKGDGEIKKIISHPQALHQCSEFISRTSCLTEDAVNTSIAARTVAESEEKGIACICSAHCAELYGLKVLQRNIADSSENFTRFIVISKEMQVEEGADIISICLSLPHISGSLYKLLTKFYYAGLNLTKIESRHMPTHIKRKSGAEGFEVIFYLDFEGSVLNPPVGRLLKNLEKDCGYYRFLGNYREM